MLRAVKDFFDQNLNKPHDRNQVTEHQLNLAAAALLFEVSRSDYAVDQRERDKIREMVTSRFAVDAGEAQRLIELAEQEAHDATCLHGFTSLITEHWSVTDRAYLAEMMWNVAYADGTLDDHEIHLMRKIERLLYIPHQRFIAGKLRARDRS